MKLVCSASFLSPPLTSPYLDAAQNLLFGFTCEGKTDWKGIVLFILVLCVNECVCARACMCVYECRCMCAWMRTFWWDPRQGSVCSVLTKQQLSIIKLVSISEANFLCAPLKIKHMIDLLIGCKISLAGNLVILFCKSTAKMLIWFRDGKMMKRNERNVSGLAEWQDWQKH